MSTVPLFIVCSRKMLPILKKCFMNKRSLFVLIAYTIFTYLILPFLNSKINPNNDNCLSFNYSDFKHQERHHSRNSSCKSTDILKTYLNKHLVHTTSENFERWIQISEDIHLYSAYIDRCPTTSKLSQSFCVIFIGMANNSVEADSTLSNMKCALKRNSNVIKIGLAIIEKLPEDHSKPYTAAFFYCQLKNFVEDNSWPDHATLYKSLLTTWLPVKYLNANDSSTDVSIDLCVRPLFGFTSLSHVTEFIVYYSSFGVQHFIFYNLNASDSTLLFLQFLKSASNLSIDLLTWDIPFSNDYIHEYGQMIFTQDCIRRSRYKFSHTIIVDFDEYISPKLHTSITDLILELDHKYENSGAYVIPMAMFCAEFTSEPTDSLFHYLKSNKRQKTPWSYGFRSKYIVRPERIHYAGIHFIWVHEINWFEVKISSSTALLHHYRNCCGMMQSWFFSWFHFFVLTDEIVIDNSLSKHVDELANNNLVLFIVNSTQLLNLCDR